MQRFWPLHFLLLPIRKPIQTNVAIRLLVGFIADKPLHETGLCDYCVTFVATKSISSFTSSATLATPGAFGICRLYIVRVTCADAVPSRRSSVVAVAVTSNVTG